MAAAAASDAVAAPGWLLAAAPANAGHANGDGMMPAGCRASAQVASDCFGAPAAT
jgi:hypothetical protein